MTVPENVADGLRSELAGLEQRLLRVGVGDVVSGHEILLREALEARVAAIRATLGVEPEKPKRATRGAKESRPDGLNGSEVR